MINISNLLKPKSYFHKSLFLKSVNHQDVTNQSIDISTGALTNPHIVSDVYNIAFSINSRFTFNNLVTKGNTFFLSINSRFYTTWLCHFVYKIIMCFSFLTLFASHCDARDVEHHDVMPWIGIDNLCFKLTLHTK